jgi:2-phosphosulfolactate phosphatase
MRQKANRMERNAMDISRASLLEGAKAARGVAVIIDVFRAFTCSPLLFSLGIQKSILVSSPEDAFVLKEANKDLILIGEVDGIPIEGFDLGNSPCEILKHGESFFSGKTVVQRTSSGVQGAIAALEVADEVLPASYALAGSTARYILSKQPSRVSLVAMGWSLKEIAPEDEWCARYISHLLGKGDYNTNEALAEILFNRLTQKFFNPDQPHFPPEDPILCLQSNIYDFILKVEREDNLVVVHKTDI